MARILAKHRGRIGRIIPFGIIWLLASIVYCVVELGIRLDSPECLTHGGPYNIAESIIIVGLSSVIMGLGMGMLEVYFLGRLFRQRPFAVYLLSKTVIYTASMVVFVISVNMIYTSHYIHHPLLDPVVLESQWYALRSISFWSIILYVMAVTFISLFYSEISNHIGHGVLINFFTGRYHTPKEEERIFMFLDMKSSTTIAEQMGHVAYFKLLNRYYADVTVAIIESSGQIYQYIGDEVVVTWTLEDGLRDNDCMACFFRIKRRMERLSGQYMKAFGHAPGFKAGLHCGPVTTGEIGIVRREITFSGDVMNTTSRIQGLCNECGVDILVSEALIAHIPPDGGFAVREVGTYELKGRDQRVRLFTVTEPSVL